MRLKWRQLCFGPGVTRLDHLVRVTGLVKTQLLLLANADVYMAFYAMLGSKAGGVRAPACQPRTFSQDPGRALEVSALLKGLSNQYVIHLLESAVTLVLQRLLSQLLQRTEQNGEPHCAQRGKQGYGPQAIDPATEASDSITVFCFVWNSAMQWCCSSRTKCVPVALIALPCGLSFTSHCHCRLQNALYNEPYMRCNPPAGVEKRCPEDCLVNKLSVPYQLSSDQAGTGGYLGPDVTVASTRRQNALDASTAPLYYYHDRVQHRYTRPPLRPSRPDLRPHRDSNQRPPTHGPPCRTHGQEFWTLTGLELATCGSVPKTHATSRPLHYCVANLAPKPRCNGRKNEASKRA